MPCQTALLWLHVSPPVPLTTAQLHPVRCGLTARSWVLLPALSPFFALDVPRAQASSAALNGTSSRAGRICRYRCRMFPCAIHTIHCHSQSIACWPFLSRDSRPHLPELPISMTSQWLNLCLFYLSIVHFGCCIPYLEYCYLNHVQELIAKIVTVNHR